MLCVARLAEIGAPDPPGGQSVSFAGYTNASFAREVQRFVCTLAAKGRLYSVSSGRAQPPHAVRRRSCMSPFRSSRANSLRCPNSPERPEIRPTVQRGFFETMNASSNPNPPATQSRLPLRIAGGRTNRAVPRYSVRPVPVSSDGMRTFDADIGLPSPGPVFD
jgi:hypothetical protein